jgi:hypothetical protein
MAHCTSFRLVALILVTVLLAMAATPAKVEAMDALTALSLATLAAGALLVVGYLIVANSEGNKSAEGMDREAWIARSSGLDSEPILPAETPSSQATAPVVPVDAPVVAVHASAAQTSAP